MGRKRKPDISASLRKKEEKARRILESLGRVMVSYSGGTDSTLLLFEATKALGAEQVVAVTAVGSIYPSHEKIRAKVLTARLKVRHHFLETSPLMSKDFIRNGPNRCYHCKKRLFKQMVSLARKMGISMILEGSQKDDSNDYRPGARAVKEFDVRSPLLEAGVTKEEVRRLSRHHGLPTADLPAMACLASRVPYGTSITEKLLSRIEKGEESIRRLGFKKFRLRHHGEEARLEFDPQEMERAFRHRRSLLARLEAGGWKYVSLDLKGYRQGSLNETIGKGRKDS